MPEGDTVWRHAQILNEALGQQTIVSSDFRVPQLATTDLSGALVIEVVSRGKHLLARFSAGDRGEWTLHSHLRMDGTWRVFAPGQPWRGRPPHTIRVVLTTQRRTAVGFQLHDVALIPTRQEDSLVGHLGPDLLGPDWDEEEAARRLGADPAREISAALLDQRNLAGVGNLYRCELLFLRGLSPWTPVGEAGEPIELVRLAHRLLLANRGRWLQTTTGQARNGQNTYVFDRVGLPCRRCGTTVHAARQGGAIAEDRITYWCPRCQPGPMPKGATTARVRR